MNTRIKKGFHDTMNDVRVRVTSYLVLSCGIKNQDTKSRWVQADREHRTGVKNKKMKGENEISYLSGRYKIKYKLNCIE